MRRFGLFVIALLAAAPLAAQVPLQGPAPSPLWAPEAIPAPAAPVTLGEARRGNHAWLGAGIGAGVGLGVGLVVGHTVCVVSEADSCTRPMIGIGLLGVLTFGVVGGLIGSLFPKGG